MEHNTDIVKRLFELNEDCLALIADGTYLYCEKSLNNKVQRKTYSGQKKRHLIKPFIIVTSDGHIVDVFGPYAATYNDAKIIENIFEKKDDFKKLIHPGDLLILDRGFRDIVKQLEKKYKIITKMPACSKEKLTTLEANHTRLVTKCRWVIEAINGIFKKSFKSLEKCRNNVLNHIMDDYRIAASLINCFWSRLISDKDDSSEIVEEMLKKINKKNDLEKYVSKNIKNLNLKPVNTLELFDFPSFDLSDIKTHITLGSYQLEQSYSYLHEHFNKNGEHSMLISDNILNENEYKILSAEVQSRHSQSTKYKVYLKYLPNSTDSSELSWCCNCMTGSRTVGCCTHVAMFIYYLSYGKYLTDLPRPGYTLDNFFTDQDYHSSDGEQEYSSNLNTERLSQTLKRSCSITFTSQPKRSSYSVLQTPSIKDFNNNNQINFRCFSSHIPEWGGAIILNEDDFDKKDDFDEYQLFERIKFTNTCSIDYFLLGLWCAHFVSSNFAQAILEKSLYIDIFKNILKIIELIDLKNNNVFILLCLLFIFFFV